MKLTKTASAGTESREDLLVTVGPGENEVNIVIDSDVGRLFGSQIEAAAREILAQYEIESCTMTIKDHSALDYVVRSRVETAVIRALEEEEK